MNISRSVQEEEVGITSFLSKTQGFKGILKERYSDFVVREIGSNGTPLLLKELNSDLDSKHFVEVQASQPQFSAANATIHLTKLIDSLPSVTKVLEIDAIIQYLSDCDSQSPDTPNFIIPFNCSDKNERTQLHRQLKSFFSLLIDSDTQIDPQGVQSIRILANFKMKKKNGIGYVKRRKDWPKDLPNYLHFTLLKENIDTLSAVGQIARSLKTDEDKFSYGGTKDKRAVTTQRLSLYRWKPSDLYKVNHFKYPGAIKIGDFSYESEPMLLGHTRGNHFDILLRDLQLHPSTSSSSPPSSSEVSLSPYVLACRAISSSGFINYFGLQRFGKGGSRSYEMGRSVYQGNFSLVLDQHFTPREGDRPETQQVKQLYWQGQYDQALRAVQTNQKGSSLLTEKNILRAILKHLPSPSPADLSSGSPSTPSPVSISAFLSNHQCREIYHSLPYNSRLICLHAYQSYLWNLLATRRVEKGGMEVLEGDMVFVGEDREGLAGGGWMGEEEEKEAIEEGKGLGGGAEGEGEESSTSIVVSSSKIHLVTAEEARAKTFSIFDVILPLLGDDVLFPSNDLKDYCFELLSRDGLSHPQCFSRMKIHGSYRFLLQRAKDFSWSLLSYPVEARQQELVKTEFSVLRENGWNFQSLSDYYKLPSSSSSTQSESSFGGLPPFPYTSPVNVVACPFPSTISEETGEPPSSPSPSPSSSLKALHISFSLPPGCYATSLLRELTKDSMETQYQSSLSVQTKERVRGGIVSNSKDEEKSNSETLGDPLDESLETKRQCVREDII